MSKKSFTDQMGNVWNINFPPKRIVSLVPSQTELLHYFGLEEEVIGITKFCIHPEEWFRSKKRIGGTKTINLEKISALQPDLIIGNKEENQKEQIEALSAQYPVWMSDIKNPEDAFEMIEMVGNLTNRSKKAGELSEELKTQFSTHQKLILSQSKKRVAYFIWRSPYMVAAGDTFIDQMLEIAGFINVYGHQERYPVITLEELKAQNPEVILLSSEPYPFKEKHIEAFQKTCPEAKIVIVDGELFSWYGSRLLLSVRYFNNLHTQLW
ncbi:MAG: ABC-type Fe3+-hydroxamate transport system substrate-binding protein [Saprospiraceae bacterium]|jgi:ABC-type Fe3+-hydroxamate transport system substrate-binding protein